MEKSRSSMNKALSSSNNGKTTENSPEDSSWTFYMQDFLCGDHDSNSSFYPSQESSPSLVSDAFSSAARKASDTNEAAVFTSDRSNCKKSLSFKRRKVIRTAVNDLDLEDTASSPANSPKLNQNQNQNEKDKIQVSEGNICRNGTRVVGISEEENNRSELKKKGLCLVPVSMLTNPTFYIHTNSNQKREYLVGENCREFTNEY